MNGKRGFVFQAVAGPFDKLLGPMGFQRTPDVEDDEFGASIAWRSSDVIVRVYVEPPDHQGDIRIFRRRSALPPRTDEDWATATIDELLRDRELTELDHRVEGGPWMGGDDAILAWAEAAAGRLSLIADILRGEDPEAFGRAIADRD